MDHAGLSTPTRILLTTACVIIIIAGLRAASEIISPLLMAAFLAIISTPPIVWLQQRGMPKYAAYGLVIFVVITVGMISGAGIRESVAQINQTLPEYESRLTVLVSGVSSWLGELGILPDGARLKTLVDPGAVIGLFGELVNRAGGLMANIFLIIMALIFILVESSTLPGKLSYIMSERKTPLASLSGFLDTVNRYFLIKTLMSLVTGVLITLWLYFLDVDFAVLWGWLAFFLNFVPYIGSIIAAVPAVLIALLGQGTDIALLAALGFVFTNIVVGNLLEPKFLGSGLGLSTLVVFVSMVFWGWVLGPVGMFLSAPLTTLLKIAVESDPKSHWLSILLGTGVKSKS